MERKKAKNLKQNAKQKIPGAHKHNIEWRISARRNLGASARGDPLGLVRVRVPKPFHVATVRKGMAKSWIETNGDPKLVYLVEVFSDGKRVDHNQHLKFCSCGFGEDIVRTFHQLPRAKSLARTASHL
jgi:hypothetical protein